MDGKEWEQTSCGRWILRKRTASVLITQDGAKLQQQKILKRKKSKKKKKQRQDLESKKKEAR